MKHTKIYGEFQIMKIKKYTVYTDKKGIDLRFACVSDLHARPFHKALEAVKKIEPDVILLPGDIVEIAAEYMNERNQNGLNFLSEAAKIAPCYYTYGNHEIYFSHAKGEETHTPDSSLGEEYLEKIKSYGIHVLNDSFEHLDMKGKGDGIIIGGLVCGRDMDPKLNCPEPDLDFLKSFSERDGIKILLCHYPHYYEKYVKNTKTDLMLSGHAHGGQWRILGRGVYAPHQGLFPKYTSGIHDGRHIISRGAANNVKPIPRFFNPCEVLEITLKSK